MTEDNHEEMFLDLHVMYDPHGSIIPFETDENGKEKTGEKYTRRKRKSSDEAIDELIDAVKNKLKSSKYNDDVIESILKTLLEAINKSLSNNGQNSSSNNSGHDSEHDELLKKFNESKNDKSCGNSNSECGELLKKFNEGKNDGGSSSNNSECGELLKKFNESKNDKSSSGNNSECETLLKKFADDIQKNIKPTNTTTSTGGVNVGVEFDQKSIEDKANAVIDKINRDGNIHCINAEICLGEEYDPEKVCEALNKASGRTPESQTQEGEKKTDEELPPKYILVPGEKEYTVNGVVKKTTSHYEKNPEYPWSQEETKPESHKVSRVTDLNGYIRQLSTTREDFFYTLSGEVSEKFKKLERIYHGQLRGISTVPSEPVAPTESDLKDKSEEEKEAILKEYAERLKVWKAEKERIDNLSDYEREEEFPRLVSTSSINLAFTKLREQAKEEGVELIPTTMTDANGRTIYRPYVGYHSGGKFTTGGKPQTYIETQRKRKIEDSRAEIISDEIEKLTKLKEEELYSTGELSKGQHLADLPKNVYVGLVKDIKDEAEETANKLVNKNPDITPYFPHTLVRDVKEELEVRSSNKQKDKYAIGTVNISDLEREVFFLKQALFNAEIPKGIDSTKVTKYAEDINKLLSIAINPLSVGVDPRKLLPIVKNTFKKLKIDYDFKFFDDIAYGFTHPLHDRKMSNSEVEKIQGKADEYRESHPLAKKIFAPHTLDEELLTDEELRILRKSRSGKFLSREERALLPDIEKKEERVKNKYGHVDKDGNGYGSETLRRLMPIQREIEKPFFGIFELLKNKELFPEYNTFGKDETTRKAVEGELRAILEQAFRDVLLSPYSETSLVQYPAINKMVTKKKIPFEDDPIKLGQHYHDELEGTMDIVVIRNEILGRVAQIMGAVKRRGMSSAKSQEKIMDAFTGLFYEGTSYKDIDNKYNEKEKKAIATRLDLSSKLRKIESDPTVKKYLEEGKRYKFINVPLDEIDKQKIDLENKGKPKNKQKPYSPKEVIFRRGLETAIMSAGKTLKFYPKYEDPVGYNEVLQEFNYLSDLYLEYDKLYKTAGTFGLTRSGRLPTNIAYSTAQGLLDAVSMYAFGTPGYNLVSFEDTAITSTNERFYDAIYAMEKATSLEEVEEINELAKNEIDEIASLGKSTTAYSDKLNVVYDKNKKRLSKVKPPEVASMAESISKLDELKSDLIPHALELRKIPIESDYHRAPSRIAPLLKMDTALSNLADIWFKEGKSHNLGTMTDLSHYKAIEYLEDFIAGYSEEEAKIAPVEIKQPDGSVILKRTRGINKQAFESIQNALNSRMRLLIPIIKELGISPEELDAVSAKNETELLRYSPGERSKMLFEKITNYLQNPIPTHRVKIKLRDVLPETPNGSLVEIQEETLTENIDKINAIVGGLEEDRLNIYKSAVTLLKKDINPNKPVNKNDVIVNKHGDSVKQTGAFRKIKSKFVSDSEENMSPHVAKKLKKMMYSNDNLKEGIVAIAQNVGWVEEIIEDSKGNQIVRVFKSLSAKWQDLQEHYGSKDAEYILYNEFMARVNEHAFGEGLTTEDYTGILQILKSEDITDKNSNARMAIDTLKSKYSEVNDFLRYILAYRKSGGMIEGIPTSVYDALAKETSLQPEDVQTQINDNIQKIQNRIRSHSSTARVIERAPLTDDQFAVGTSASSISFPYKIGTYKRGAVTYKNKYLVFENIMNALTSSAAKEELIDHILKTYQEQFLMQPIPGFDSNAGKGFMMKTLINMMYTGETDEKGLPTKNEIGRNILFEMFKSKFGFDHERAREIMAILSDLGGYKATGELQQHVKEHNEKFIARHFMEDLNERERERALSSPYSPYSKTSFRDIIKKYYPDVILPPVLEEIKQYDKAKFYDKYFNTKNPESRKSIIPFFPFNVSAGKPTQSGKQTMNKYMYGEKVKDKEITGTEKIKNLFETWKSYGDTEKNKTSEVYGTINNWWKSYVQGEEIKGFDINVGKGHLIKSIANIFEYYESLNAGSGKKFLDVVTAGVYNDEQLTELSGWFKDILDKAKSEYEVPEVIRKQLETYVPLSTKNVPSEYMSHFPFSEEDDGDDRPTIKKSLTIEEREQKESEKKKKNAEYVEKRLAALSKSNEYTTISPGDFGTFINETSDYSKIPQAVFNRMYEKNKEEIMSHRAYDMHMLPYVQEQEWDKFDRREYISGFAGVFNDTSVYPPDTVERNFIRGYGLSDFAGVFDLDMSEYRGGRAQLNHAKYKLLLNELEKEDLTETDEYKHIWATIQDYERRAIDIPDSVGKHIRKWRDLAIRKKIEKAQFEPDEEVSDRVEAARIHNEYVEKVEELYKKPFDMSELPIPLAEPVNQLDFSDYKRKLRILDSKGMSGKMKFIKLNGMLNRHIFREEPFDKASENKFNKLYNELLDESYEPKPTPAVDYMEYEEKLRDLRERGLEGSKQYPQMVSRLEFFREEEKDMDEASRKQFMKWWQKARENANIPITKTEEEAISNPDIGKKTKLSDRYIRVRDYVAKMSEANDPRAIIANQLLSSMQGKSSTKIESEITNLYMEFLGVSRRQIEIQNKMTQAENMRNAMVGSPYQSEADSVFNMMGGTYNYGLFEKLTTIFNRFVGSVKDFSSEAIMLADLENKFGASSKKYQKAKAYYDEMVRLNDKSGPDSKNFDAIYNKYMGKKFGEDKSPISSIFSNLVGGFVMGVINKIESTIMGIGSKIMSIFGDVVKKTLMFPVNSFKKSVALFTSSVKKALGKSQAYSGLSELMMTPLVLAVEYTMIPTLKKLIPAIKEVINWTTASKDKFTLMGKYIGVTVNKVYDMLTGNFVLSFEKIFAVFNKYSNWIDTEFSNSDDTFFSKLSTDFSTLSQNIGSISTAVTTANNELVAYSKGEGFGAVANGIITNIIDSIGESLRTSIKTFIGIADNDAFNLKEIIVKVFENIIDAGVFSTELVSKLLTQLTNSITEILSNDKYQTLLSNIESNLVTVMQKVMDIVRNIVTQSWFASGVKDIVTETFPIWGQMLALSGLVGAGSAAAGKGLGAIFTKIGGILTGGSAAATVGAGAGAAASTTAGTAAGTAGATGAASTAATTAATSSASLAASVAGGIGTAVALALLKYDAVANNKDDTAINVIGSNFGGWYRKYSTKNFNELKSAINDNDLESAMEIMNSFIPIMTKGDDVLSGMDKTLSTGFFGLESLGYNLLSSMGDVSKSLIGYNPFEELISYFTTGDFTNDLYGKLNPDTDSEESTAIYHDGSDGLPTWEDLATEYAKKYLENPNQTLILPEGLSYNKLMEKVNELTNPNYGVDQVFESKKFSLDEREKILDEILAQNYGANWVAVEKYAEKMGHLASYYSSFLTEGNAEKLLTQRAAETGYKSWLETIDLNPSVPEKTYTNPINLGSGYGADSDVIKLIQDIKDGQNVNLGINELQYLVSHSSGDYNKLMRGIVSDFDTQLSRYESINLNSLSVDLKNLLYRYNLTDLSELINPTKSLPDSPTIESFSPSISIYMDKDNKVTDSTVKYDNGLGTIRALNISGGI